MCSIFYTSDLTKYVIEHSKESDAITAQKDSPNTDIFTGLPFKDSSSELTDADKQAAFLEYINDLDDSGKAQAYVQMMSIPTEADPVLTVSIHQNSYPEEYVHGAQVFYYNGSSGGEQLAGLIQTQLVQDLDPENHRQIKPNDSYYLLKKTKGTIVIVECGFLSNAAEAGKLCDEAYQDRVAWSIHKGILQYINGIQRD